MIITTNYDLLLEAAHIRVFGKSPIVATPNDLTDVLFKLHGTVEQPKTIVLGESDYVRLYSHDYYKSLLRTILMSRTVMILGSSFSDHDIARLFAEVRDEGNYMLLRKGERHQFEFERFRRQFGIQVIEYEPSDGYPELVKLIQHLVKIASRSRASRYR